MRQNLCEPGSRSRPLIFSPREQLDMRTAILLAGLTGFFMAVGYLIGGGAGHSRGQPTTQPFGAGATTCATVAPAAPDRP